MERPLLDDSAAFAGDPFFDVPRQRVELSIGDVLMPALCRQVAVRMPLWFVDAGAAAQKMAGTGLAPRRFGKRAVVGLSFFRYGFATVGPYSEVGIVVVARSERRFRGIGGTRNPLRLVPRPAGGLAAVELALDSELAMAGGIELLGLSKYLATIDHAFRGDRFEFAVRNAETGVRTLAVSGRIGPGVVLPSPTLFNVSNVDGANVHIRVDTDSSWRIGPPLGVRVSCHAGDGHLGSHVADLGLAERRPFCVLAADDLRGRLHLGVRLDDGRPAGSTRTVAQPFPPFRNAARAGDETVRETARVGRSAFLDPYALARHSHVRLHGRRKPHHQLRLVGL